MDARQVRHSIGRTDSGMDASKDSNNRIGSAKPQQPGKEGYTDGHVAWLRRTLSAIAEIGYRKVTRL